MQISFSTGDWQKVLRIIGDPRAAPEPLAGDQHGASRETTPDDAPEDEDDEEYDLFVRLNEALASDPITSAGGDSMIYNGEFGGVFLACKDRLPREDFATLGRFIASFCSMVGGFPVPRDADLGAHEWFAVMSPSTLSELAPLPERVDRRALRAAVRAALVSRKASFPSVGHFFDYLDMWTRAYRLAAAGGLCGAIHLG